MSFIIFSIFPLHLLFPSSLIKEAPNKKREAVLKQKNEKGEWERIYMENQLIW